MDAIVTEKIMKSFKKKGRRRFLHKVESDETIFACDGVNMRIGQGELFGLLGPNGAGKTTLVKVLSTLLIPDSGAVYIEGINTLRDPIAARKILGVTTGGERTLYWKLSAHDNLRYFASLYGIPSQEAEKRIAYLLDIMELTDKQHMRLEKFSTGMRQKVSIARAILHDPRVILLDEPTLGLDPSFSRFLRKFIREELNQTQKKTILLTTHYMDEAEQLCDRIAFMNRGRIVVLDTPDNLKRSIPHEEVLELRCVGTLKDNLAGLEGINRSYFTYEDGVTTVRIHADDTEKVMTSVIDVVRKQARIISVHVTKPTLEDVFIHLTGVKLTDETGEKGE